MRGISSVPRLGRGVSPEPPIVAKLLEPVRDIGLKVPSGYEVARERVPWLGRTAPRWSHLVPGLSKFWRFDPMTARDIDWFELKYPGWYGYYGKFWEEYQKRCDPRNGELALSLFASLPPLCRVCQMPCVFPRLDISTCRTREFAGKRHAFCSAACEMFFDQEPQRYLGYTSFYELFDGYDLADFISKWIAQSRRQDPDRATLAQSGTDVDDR